MRIIPLLKGEKNEIDVTSIIGRVTGITARSKGWSVDMPVAIPDDLAIAVGKSMASNGVICVSRADQYWSRDMVVVYKNGVRRFVELARWSNGF